MSGLTSGESDGMTVVCWDASDAGCLTDRLRRARQLRGKTFVETTARIGKSTLVIIELTGPDPARSIGDALVVNRPPWIVLAGTGEAISGNLPLDTIVLPTRFRRGDQSRGLQPLINPRQPLPPRTVWGTLDGSRSRPAFADPPSSPAESEEPELVVWAHTLGDLAGLCDERHVPWTAVLSVRQNAERPAVREVEAVRRQAGWAGKLGAAAAAVWRRPRVALDLVHQQQRDLVAGDRLANFIISLL